MLWWTTFQRGLLFVHACFVAAGTSIALLLCLVPYGPLFGLPVLGVCLTLAAAFGMSYLSMGKHLQRPPRWFWISMGVATAALPLTLAVVLSQPRLYRLFPAWFGLTIACLIVFLLRRQWVRAVAFLITTLVLTVVLPIRIGAKEGLQSAVNSGSGDHLRFLLRLGANPNQRFQKHWGPGKPAEWTLLHEAAIGPSEECLWTLIKAGAEVDGRNHLGDTALFGAVRHGRKTYVEDLLKTGAAVDAENAAGETPLFDAPTEEIEALLLAHGADPLHRDKRGRRAAEWRSEVRHIPLNLGIRGHGRGPETTRALER